jgi:hypothetical protein
MRRGRFSQRRALRLKRPSRQGLFSIGTPSLVCKRHASPWLHRAY